MRNPSKATTNIPPFRFHAFLAMASLMVADTSISHAQSASEASPTAPTPEATSTEPASTEQAEQPEKAKKRRIPPIGPEFEVFYLLDSKTRDRFGSSISGIGPGFGSTIPRMKARVRPDFSLLRADRTVDGNKNKLFVLSVGPEYRNVLVPSRYRSQTDGESLGTAEGAPPSLVPYYGVGLNAIYAKVKVPGEGLDESGLGIGGTLMLGVAIKRNAVIEARVRATSRVEGYGFSGVGLTFGLRF